MINVLMLFPLLYLFNAPSVASIDELTLKQYKHYAQKSAIVIYQVILYKFHNCMKLPTGNQMFKSDDLQGYLVSPARTTVGVAPNFTTNRKYFANMLATTEFKEMLAEDTTRMHQDLLEKIKYCDTVVMEPDILRHYYHRGPDEPVVK